MFLIREEASERTRGREKGQKEEDDDDDENTKQKHFKVKTKFA